LKLSQRDEALLDLSLAIGINEQYVKALLKRSELYMGKQMY